MHGQWVLVQIAAPAQPAFLQPSQVVHPYMGAQAGPPPGQVSAPAANAAFPGGLPPAGHPGQGTNNVVPFIPRNARLVRPLSNAPDPWDAKIAQMPTATPEILRMAGLTGGELLPDDGDLRQVNYDRRPPRPGVSDGDPFGGRPLSNGGSDLSGGGGSDDGAA